MTGQISARQFGLESSRGPRLIFGCEGSLVHPGNLGLAEMVQHIHHSLHQPSRPALPMDDAAHRIVQDNACLRREGFRELEKLGRPRGPPNAFLMLVLSNSRGSS